MKPPSLEYWKSSLPSWPNHDPGIQCLKMREVCHPDTQRTFGFVGIGPWVYHFEIRSGIPTFLSPWHPTCYPWSKLHSGTRTVASDPSWQHRAFASKRFFSKTSLHLNKTSWWFQPLHLKICLSKWIIFLSRGKNKRCLNPLHVFYRHLNKTFQKWWNFQAPNRIDHFNLGLPTLCWCWPSSFTGKFFKIVSLFKIVIENACCNRPRLKIWGVSSKKTFPCIDLGPQSNIYPLAVGWSFTWPLVWSSVLPHT